MITALIYNYDKYNIKKFLFQYMKKFKEECDSDNNDNNSNRYNKILIAMMIITMMLLMKTMKMGKELRL